MNILIIYYVIISMFLLGKEKGKGKDKQKNMVNNIINIYLPKNNLIFISILSIFVMFSALLYLKPFIFNFAFHTILGNLLLIIGFTCIWFLDKKFSIGLAFLLLIIYLSMRIGSTTTNLYNDIKVKEGFNDKPWSQETIEEFNEFQKVTNPDIKYDINIVQKQATEEEVKKLVQTGKWPWSQEIKNLYMSAIDGTSNIKIDPGIALSNAQAIYNETAMKGILSWGSKEGTFLLSGAIIGHPENMPKNINNYIRCGTSKDGSLSPIMQKTEYLGYNGINSSMEKKITDVANSDIPELVTGFSFINGECNPCLPLEATPNYSCPFKLNIGNGTEVSEIWKNLWNLDRKQK